jgi:hypothetical protein
MIEHVKDGKPLTALGKKLVEAGHSRFLGFAAVKPQTRH